MCNRPTWKLTLVSYSILHTSTTSRVSTRVDPALVETFWVLTWTHIPTPLKCNMRIVLGTTKHAKARGERRCGKAKEARDLTNRVANGVVAKQRKHATWQTARPWTPSPADHASEPTTSTGGIKANAMRDDGDNEDGCQECDVVRKA